MPLLEARAVTKRFGGLTAVNRVDFAVERGITAVIGPNGAGKTSIFNAISGFYRPESGRILFEGRNVTRLRPPLRAALGIARTFQNIALFRGMTVLDNIKLGRHAHMRTTVVDALLYRGRARAEEIALRREIEERIIDFLEINHIRKAPAGTLPYGLQKRVELGRALAAEPQLLLLDEPMAGMNLEEKEDMARFILDVNDEWGTTIILIEHDMGVVMDISHRVLVLDFGRTLAEGRPEEILVHPEVRRAYLGEGDAAPVPADEAA